MAKDIEKFSKSDKTALATISLDSKNRIKFDCIISKNSNFSLSDPVFFIDVHHSQSSSLHSSISQLNFRKNVNFFDISSETEVTATYSQSLRPEAKEGYRQEWSVEADPTINIEDTDDYIAFVDPRLKSLGTRTICPKDCLEINDELTQTDLNHYKSYRILAGVPEGQILYAQSPFLFGLEHLNMIDLKKNLSLEKEKEKMKRTESVLPFAVCDQGDKNFAVMDSPFFLLDEEFKEVLGGKVLDGSGNVVGIVLDSCKNVGFVKGSFDTMKDCFLEDGKKIILWKPFVS